MNATATRPVTAEDLQVGRRLHGKEILAARVIPALEFSGVPERHIITREDGEQIVHIGTHFPVDALG